MQIRSFAARFVRTEASGGILLAAAALCGLVWANAWPGSYDSMLHAPYLESAISEGLMTIFFLVVGLEIARELRSAERGTAVLPVAAALGGMVVPAAVFLAINAGGDAGRGWAIPTATDIAFAMGVVTLLGRWVPAPLRVFLLALAIVDDLAAIVVLALFYSASPDVLWLGACAACFAGYDLVGRRGPAWPLVLLGALGWYALYRSGVHPALAGVAAGVLTPPPLSPRLEERLHPVSVYVVLPLFAVVNAGVALSGFGDAVTSRVGLGVVLGLVAGKPLGILAGTALAVRLGCRLPGGVSWRQLAGVGCVAGIGFTVSLFVTSLAYTDPARVAAAKAGIVVGSLAAAALGAAVLASARHDPDPDPDPPPAAPTPA